VILRHEALELDIPQVGTLAAQRFRQQESRSVSSGTTPWDELHEFHVADFSARA